MNLIRSKRYAFGIITILILLLNNYAFGYPGEFSIKNQRAALENQIKKIKEKIERDKKALSNLGFDNTIKGIEEWINISDEAKKEFENTLTDELINISLLGIKNGTKSIGSIGTGQGNKIIGFLQEKGINMPLLNKAIRTVAHIKGKPAKAKAVIKLTEHLEKARDIYKITKDGPTHLKNLATVLGWLLKDPRLNIIVSSVNIFIASVYSTTATIISKNNIERLTELTEDQLKAQKKIIEILTKHVKELKYMQDLKSRLEEIQREDESKKEQRKTERDQINDLIEIHNEKCVKSCITEEEYNAIKPWCEQKARELEALKKEYKKKWKDWDNMLKDFEERKARLDKEISEFLQKQ